MKNEVKFILVITYLYVFLAILTYACANSIPRERQESGIEKIIHINKGEIHFDIDKNIIRLPISLMIIEDEAFEGTAIEQVELSDSVISIGNQAFANIKTLRSIRIPMSTISIAKTAFAGSQNVMITATPNSYAWTWAKENRLPLSPFAVLCAGTDSQSVVATLSYASKEVLDTAESSEKQETNRIWRKLEEIQAHGTIEIIANVVQGRAPPMA
ncbi:MAG: leucine-rich repeat protein [Anaerolineaceae bacterium]|nr:leucine-rich repeat protein [Anaerolineaceae bacterium]